MTSTSSLKTVDTSDKGNVTGFTASEDDIFSSLTSLHT